MWKTRRNFGFCTGTDSAANEYIRVFPPNSLWITIVTFVLILRIWHVFLLLSDGILCFSDGIYCVVISFLLSYHFVLFHIL